MSVTSDAMTRGGSATVGNTPSAPDGSATEPQPRSGQSTSRPLWRRVWDNRDVRALLIFVVLAGWVTDRLWRYMGNYMVTANVPDHVQFEYFLTWATRVVTRFDNPFFLSQLNAPNGVNLMDNTPCYGLTIPLVPVTLLFGPDMSFAVMTFVALAATAAAWYWFFSRHLVKSWAAALVGGLFCGFAPGMMSQALAHPNIAAQFVIPLILSQLVRLREPGHTVRRGLVLGLLHRVAGVHQ